ncbi:DUF3040 domain-containing protein [Corynebacterium resistens]|uniref:DUF3040 domain-containing protein n=1 Tax=Corynebacterium resistens TaxID=258224 RepID=UPI0023544A89|nr:DUF3040 domain-containing protein [Corynebacterium resistens]
MALSEQEKRMLEEIERALIAEDPRLARRASVNGDSTANFSFGIRSVALMMLGLVMLIGGIALAQNSLWFVVLSVLGFVVMFLGGLLIFKPELLGSAKPKMGQASAIKLGKAMPEKRQVRNRNSNGGFGDRLEDSFKRRFDS